MGNNTPHAIAPSVAPLAERARPHLIEDFVGQEQLLGENKLLWHLIQKKQIPSLILWGPPGTGKTTLAQILARNSNSSFVFFSAVLSGVKDIREIVKQSKIRLEQKGGKTLLFVDEIHRFNKSQQDAFLPHVESGLLTLIGATTENPSFHVIAPLLSRCQVMVLKSLSCQHLTTILQRAATNSKFGLGEMGLQIDNDALDHLVNMADGDARIALNSLDISAAIAETAEDVKPHINLEIAEEAIQRRSLRYDKAGEEHYNLISALHKSLRDSDPDGSLYWLCRMLSAGEDPLYIARRLIRFASEDIGNADPQALAVSINSRDSYHTLGSPEGELALAQAVIYLATAPKSNAVYLSYKDAMKEIKESGTLPVPMHIRNAPTKLMKELGYGSGYQYAHDQHDALVCQDHLPTKLKGKTFYHPTNRGYEALIKDRLVKWRKILKEREKSNKA